MYSLDKVVKFLIKYAHWDEDEKVYDKVYYIVKKHLEYNTIIILWDLEDVQAVVRWNEVNNKAHILDCIIRPDLRSFRFIKSLIRFGLNKFEHIDKLVWEREVKYPNRKQKEYNGKS